MRAVPATIYFTPYLLYTWGESPYFLRILIALTLALFAWYLLFYYSKYRWVSVFLTIAAELIDCRIMLLILPFALILYFVAGDKRGKRFKICVIGLIGVCIGSILVLNLPLLRSYYSGDTLSDNQTIQNAFQVNSEALSEEYPQYIKDEALQSKISEYLNLPHTYVYYYSSAFELIANSTDSMFRLESVLFDDSFQLSVLLSFVLLLIAQRIERAGFLEAQQTQQ